AGSYVMELFIASSCAWTATSNVSWATFDTFGVGSGHSRMLIKLANNTTGPARSGNVTIAGRSIPITQLAGPDPVVDGAVDQLQNGSGCLTRNTSNQTLYTSACAWNKSSQKWSLRQASGLDYAVANAGNCIDVYNNAGQIGSQVAGYGC